MEVIDDNSIKDKKSINRVVLTSGKVYYELLKYKEINEITDTAIVRLEQYYPYPGNQIREILKSYPSAKKVNWVQEEPQNMGAWNFLYPRLMNDLAKGQKINYVGKPESPSPSPGSAKIFNQMQEDLVKKAFK